MKVAIITPFGAEERLDNFAEFILAQGLKQKNEDVRFFTYRMRSNPDYAEVQKTYKGVPVWRCEQKSGWSPRLIWQILTWRPEVVILCHIRNYLTFSAYLASRLIGAKIIFQVIGFLHDPAISTDREDPLDTILPKVNLVHTLPGFFGSLFKKEPLSVCWENYIFHKPLYRADVRVTITEFEREKLQTVAGLNSKVIPWGIPAEPPSLNACEPKAVNGKGMPSEFLLLIAQIKRRKGWDTVVEAIARLKQQGVKEKLVFVTPSSPEECAEAYQRVKGLGIAEQVTFLRKIPNEEKAWLFRHAKATLVPSRYEGFGLPIFESWSYGVPVLGTDIPVFTDFLLHQETGLVSKKGDPISLAENIKLLNDPALREKIISGGKKMLAQYDDKSIVERFETLMRSLTRS